MPPPYGLTRVGYVIVAEFGEPASLLQIHERTGAGPGKLRAGPQASVQAG